MNILVLSHRVPFPPNKGEKIRTFHQIQFLARQGHSISLAYPYDNEQDGDYGEQLKAAYCQQVISQAIGAKPLRLLRGLLSGRALSVANFYSRALQQKIDNLLAEQRFDAILCTASSMAEYVFCSASLASMSQKPSLFMDFMDLDSDKWRQYATKARIPLSWVYAREARLVARYEGRIGRSFSACFFITETECALFHQINPGLNNIYAIENGMDTSAFHPAPQLAARDKPILLFTGVMDYAPNVDAVLWFVEHVWPAVLKKWPEAEFIIAGMNPNAAIVALQKTQGIEVTGFVEDILPYFHRANIFVAPFRIARGVQNKILQAFACGLPVITTPMGAEGIRCHDGKDILLAESPAQFIDHIALLLSDTQKYQSLSSQALETIKTGYEWDALLAPMQSILKQYQQSGSSDA